MVAALCKEIELQHHFFEEEIINTVYFGGGTPSLLEMDECTLLMQAINKNFKLSADAEITLEANPDDITKERLQGWRNIGINRLSIGIQSFFEEELQWMNRAHSALQAHGCIEESLGAGFTNMSIDLIYGSPLLTDEMWRQNVNTAVSYGIRHLSCYALTVEEKTPLHKQIHLHQKKAIDNNKGAHQFLALMQWLKEKGYEHYEVSNFAKPGYRSRHNSSYWRGEKYLGIGPSAHSYSGFTRQWNLANNHQYIASIKNGIVPKEEEHLTNTQKLNEYIMISLRTMEGIDLKKAEKNWGKGIVDDIIKRIKRYADNGLINLENDKVRLTENGMLMADGIAADLFSTPLSPPSGAGGI
jgi:oxygen-independent coproporphyrinogen-3 oxidase